MTYTLTINGYKFTMNDYVHENLMIIQNEAIPNKWDALFIVFGKEGTGKTTLASQGCILLDNKFDLSKVEFIPEKFGVLIDKAPPESSVLWDEAITGAASENHANKISQLIISKLTQIRKKRLKIWICFPYLYMLNKYFISRCVASFYVYSKGFTNRGHLYAYNQGQTEYLYSLMKEKYRLKPSEAIKKAQRSFYCDFSGTFCLPEDEYDKKKELARLTEDAEPGNIWKDRLILLSKHCIAEYGAKRIQLAKAIKMDQGNFGRILNMSNEQ